MENGANGIFRVGTRCETFENPLQVIDPILSHDGLHHRQRPGIGKGSGVLGNFTAALGVPTLDGLGAVGEGAHSPEENIVVRALPERAALVAGLLSTI